MVGVGEVRTIWVVVLFVVDVIEGFESFVCEAAGGCAGDTEALVCGCCTSYVVFGGGHAFDSGFVGGK